MKLNFKRKKLPLSFYNPITLFGSGLAMLSFGLILFLTVLEAFSEDNKPYAGILTFIVLPGFLILGLLIIAYGIIREHRRELHGKFRDKLPIIDLNDNKHKRAFLIFSVGTILLIAFTAFGSFKAYEYTESDAFCGTICHKVMEPEYTAYKYSPHSRTGCVNCHIGPGAGWFVKSKISGSYQVYSVLFHKFPRPIEAPISNLRPAKETCEQCHWPKVFYGEKEITNTYYLSDENNTKMTLSMLIKIGGGTQETGVTSGIHWHMNISNQITYLATDRERQIIPWVEAKSTITGKATIYRSTNEKVTPVELKNGEYRTMDCIDCHNRATHMYSPPATSVNHVMAAGWIDPTLPYIKSISVKVLDRGYTTTEIALDSIKTLVEDFYQANFPEVFAGKRDKIESAISQLQKIYSRNYFPYMNVSWRKFPDNIGHMYSAGCFRCHDGKHVSSDGKVISNKCSTCHTILSQQIGNEKPEFSLNGVDYVHPVNVDKSWKSMLCSDCHTRQEIP
ncbi:MAG TPA: NapC/NirT family cytochrome c [Ignavibacteriaceae bacterium]|nr:NapC/NirT family cytochrome c [Ignavibacteriaceae bacterium]